MQPIRAMRSRIGALKLKTKMQMIGSGRPEVSRRGSAMFDGVCLPIYLPHAANIMGEGMGSNPWGIPKVTIMLRLLAGLQNRLRLTRETWWMQF